MIGAGAPHGLDSPGSATDDAAEQAIIALVDDRELTRHCVQRWLAEAWPDHAVVAVPTVRHLGERLRLRRSLRFALLGVPAGRVMAPETLAAIAHLHRALPRQPLMILAEDEGAGDVGAAIRAGARGYIPMSLGREAAVEAIRFVLAGGTFVPAGVINGSQLGDGVRAGGPRAAPARLSPRELEVAARLRQGRPNKLIAHELAISESTVKVFVRRILAKLGAANRTEAALVLERLLASPAQDQERSA